MNPYAAPGTMATGTTEDDVAASVVMGARFEPAMSASDRSSHLGRWSHALKRTRL